MLPFGLSTVVIVITLRTSSSDRPLATSFAGSTWTRTDGFCWPPIVTCATPEIWLICWASWASTESETVVSGRGSEVADSNKIGEAARLALWDRGGGSDVAASNRIGEAAGLTLRYVGGVGRFFGNWPPAPLMPASTSLAAPS